MDSNILAIESVIGTKIINTSSVSGGDINDASRIETKDTSFFVKLNDAYFASDMFEKEARGLGLIRESNTIPVPKVISFRPDKIDYRLEAPSSFLILEWIETGNPSTKFWKNFGIQLASMHQQTAPTFGLDHSNYIGSIEQPNEPEKDAVSFFINQRLSPQIELAKTTNRIDSQTISASS